MAYWLFKSEPSVYSYADLEAEPDRSTGWDGVRNYQARNLLRDQVQVGDLVLFYHSSSDPPAVAGVCEVTEAGHPDPPRWTRPTRITTRKATRSARRGFRSVCGPSARSSRLCRWGGCGNAPRSPTWSFSGAGTGSRFSPSPPRSGKP